MNPPVGDNGARQLVFDLGGRPALGREDFLVAPPNETAVAWIDLWPDWPAPTVAVFGPAGSGKSHLAAVFQSRSGARALSIAGLGAMGIGELTAVAPAAVLDLGGDAGCADEAQERALFHLMNLVAERRGSLLLVARSAPARWPVALADLRSRLGAVPAIGIAPPDDMLMRALLVKLFADKQLRVGEEVVRYIADRIERSFEAARAVVDRIDHAALRGRRGITVPFVRAFFDA